MLWTDQQRQRLRDTQKKHMPDWCTLYDETTPLDVEGQPMEPIYNVIDGSRCAFTPAGSTEPGSGVVTTQDQVRLPFEKKHLVNSHDRVEITERYGESLIDTLVYEVDGMPQEGPTAIVVKLIRITT